MTVGFWLHIKIVVSGLNFMVYLARQDFIPPPILLLWPPIFETDEDGWHDVDSDTDWLSTELWALLLCSRCYGVRIAVWN